MSVKNELLRLQSELPSHVQLIAVSKTHSADAIKEAYDAGQFDFGENKVQELVEKANMLPKDIRWHLIGHLQTNKVKFIAPFVHLIHAVDSMKLLHEIEKHAALNNRIISVLIQIRIAAEETKFGLPAHEAPELFEQLTLFPHIQVKGLMGMATFTTDTSQIKREFESLFRLYTALKVTYPHLDTLSMGMSGDYHEAIACGSNMIRIGSRIFGNRNYGT